MEPMTPWRHKVPELAKRNNHGVRVERIREMLLRFNRSIDLDEWLADIRKRHPSIPPASVAVNSNTGSTILSAKSFFPRARPTTGGSVASSNSSQDSNTKKNKSAAARKTKKPRQEDLNYEAFKSVARSLDPDKFWLDLSSSTSEQPVKEVLPPPPSPPVPLRLEVATQTVDVGDLGDLAMLSIETKHIGSSRGFIPSLKLDTVCRSGFYCASTQTEREDCSDCPDMLLAQFCDVFPNAPHETLKYYLEMGNYDADWTMEALLEVDHTTSIVSQFTSPPTVLVQKENQLNNKEEDDEIADNDDDGDDVSISSCTGASNIGGDSGGILYMCELFPKVDVDKLDIILKMADQDISWATNLILETDTIPAEAADSTSSETSVVKGESITFGIWDSSCSPVVVSSELLTNGCQDYVDEEESFTLGLSSRFMKAAHDKFKDTYNTRDCSIDNIPEEMYFQWKPPDHLIAQIYSSFMSHVGYLEAPASDVIPSSRNKPNNNSSSNYRKYGQLTGLNSSRPQSTINCSSSKQGSNSENLSLREIMKEEEAIQKSLDTNKKQTMAITLKCKHLLECFPHIEPVHMEQILQQCNWSEVRAKTYLVLNGHRFQEASRVLEESSRLAEGEEEEGESGEEDDDHLSHAEQETLRQDLEKEISRRQRLVNQMKTVGNFAETGYYNQEARLSYSRIRNLEDSLTRQIVSRQRRQSGLFYLDLHELSVRSALIVLRTRYTEVITARRTGAGSGNGVSRSQLTLVTGVGKHSPGGKARVRPAVANWLTNKGVTFTESQDGGVFYIDLTV